MPTTEKKTVTAKAARAAAPASGIDLAQLFNITTQALANQQTSLNQADMMNGNHGDNMVQIFQLITQAVNAKQGQAPSEQLNYASQMLAKNATSGSSRVYAQGLSQAAQQFQGQRAVSPDLAMSLVQTLLGGGQAHATQPTAGADLLGTLLGGMQSGGQPQPSGGTDLLGTLLGGGQPSSQPAAGADLLGQLLGGMQQPGGQSQPAAGADLLGQLLGGGQPQQAGSSQSGLDMGDLLTAGMAFMQAKQQGKDNLQAAVSALMAASPLNQQSHRQQSGEVVATALLSAISMLAKK